jgi:5-methylcytosine-specific restriction endonuclease McrA
MQSVLSQRALVLNRSWFVISTTTVRQALTLLFKGSAHAVCAESYELHSFESWLEREHDPDAPTIATPRRAIPLPEVIVLTHYDGVPKAGTGFSRRGLLQRDRWTCQYCQRPMRTGGLTIDHVLPRSRGGDTSWENCVAACAPCNSRKGDRTPAEASMPLRQAPRRPSIAHVRGTAAGERRPAWRPFLKRLES